MGEKREKKLPQHYDESDPIEEQVVRLLLERGLTLTTAESLTGGLIAAAVTSVPGASECFKLGFVTYSNKAKRKLLSVKKELLKKEGAISEQTAREMAIGALMESEADIGSCAKGKTKVLECRFEGNRREIREQTVKEALRLVRRLILSRFD